MEHTDRISELYKGEIFTPQTQAVARERIHWICDRVEGRKVVDIGCSQGVVSILLARKGFDIVGIDTDAKAIEYAKADRAKEPAEVQERLTFVEGDIYDIDLPEHGFDTVIMGEFLEHLVGPQEAINRAYALLSDGGRLIVTTPFGLLRAPDHKQTFYVASLYKMIQPLFVITEAVIIGRYLCLVCDRRRSVVQSQIDSIDLSLVEMAEHQFEQREVALTEERDARVKNSAELKSDLNTTRAQLNTHKKETTRLQTELAKEKRKTQAVRDSLSFRLGSALIRPVARPGRFALRLMHRIYRMSPDGFRRVILQILVRSKLLTSLAAIVRTPARSLVSAKSKAAVPLSDKAHVMDQTTARMNSIKENIGTGASDDSQPRRRDLKIAVIMDEFTFECFRYEAHLVTVTPDNWKQVLVGNRPDFLFVESAWHGNQASWRGHVINLGQNPGSQLPALVQWCRDRGIPTAFWNKEDPAHYHEFLDAARLFDYVFTTDADCMERYKKDLGHSSVFCLPFAVQPRMHNPVGSGQKIRDVAFAGSWYASAAEDKKSRREQMATVLVPALRYGVDIYDRNYSMDSDRYRFPEQYQSCIVGELPYDEMVYAYKMYKVFLNVSSVSDSPTMLPRRVVEILASGTAVLSGYCKGIENMLGSDIVPVSSSPQETQLLLRKLLDDNELRDRLAHLGLRKVMQEHTYEKRLDYVLQTMGIDKGSRGAKKRGVSIITSTNKLIYMENIFSNYDRQQYEEKELIIILNNNVLDIDQWLAEAAKHDNATVYRVDEAEPLGVCLNYGIERARFDYISKFDDDNYYAPAFLEDLMNAFEYTDADIVGKYTGYMYFENGGILALNAEGREHCYTRYVLGSAIIIRREVFAKVPWPTDRRQGSDSEFLRRSVDAGLRMYSADRFNYVCVRRASPELHTWKIADEEQLAKCRIISYTDDYVTHITC